MKVPACIRDNVPLAERTTFRIGGPARWFAEPGTRGDLAEALAFAKRMGLRVLPLGGGSNLLVDDAGIDALVIRLAPNSGFAGVERVEGEARTWRAGAATPLQGLVGLAGRSGAAGLESLAGIPGTLGGAAKMNAGGKEGGIGRFVVEAEVCDFEGGMAVLPGVELGFGYRTSDLAGRMALALTVRLVEDGEPEELMRKTRDYAEKKRLTQPLNLPSAGCVFKNPAGDSAGRLLDAAGCKGMRRGGAEVSGLHANFIVNRGGATASEVLDLARAMRDTVAERFAVGLEPEMLVWSGDSRVMTL